MSKVSWPENLIEELAYRRCILFLGSGISATAKNDEGKSPETWGNFLNNIKNLIINPKPEDIDFIDKMLRQENYLLALQVIYDLSDPGAYSKYLKDNFSRGRFSPSPLHLAIKQIDSKIVITTNFDKIYDNLCNEDGYVKYDYQKTKSIISNIKSPENIIIKAHGTIDDTDEIIFTAQQYYEKQAANPDFYALLEALFMTNTVLFLGYSLNDPDINLVMQSIRNTSSSHCPHYIVIKEGTPKHIIKHWERTYNVSCLHYGPNHENLEENIEELKNLVLGLREDRQIP
ncbi:Sir2-like protein [Desulfitobacterium hafniense]|uniref:Sir2-like protein n=1 Tax=Desulfitobacterium hafniense TaxID=49338 RepID=A0A098B954_DESHA|nr:SIR2 family protein [Desulfitobacterium hafniense]CDX04897.1 Sir2-like protein [Desulfitobacterium hafniense]